MTNLWTTLADGFRRFADGVRRFADGSPTVRRRFPTVSDGSATVSDGFRRFLATRPPKKGFHDCGPKRCDGKRFER